MNYWQRWIGDWKRKTSSCSAVEKGVYGELLDHMYAHEVTSLPGDRTACYRIAMALDQQEQRAVDSVLERFFTLGPDGYRNGRVHEEIERHKTYLGQQRAKAEKRWGTHGNAAAMPEHAAKDPRGTRSERGKTLKGWIAGQDWPAVAKAWGAQCAKERPDLGDPGAVIMRFLDYWEANANQRTGKKASWDAAWRNWFRKERTGKPGEKPSDGKITCRGCGARVLAHTDGLCNTCWVDR